jgi:hypothetical protein
MVRIWEIWCWKSSWIISLIMFYNIQFSDRILWWKCNNIDLRRRKSDFINSISFVVSGIKISQNMLILSLRSIYEFQSNFIDSWIIALLISQNQNSILSFHIFWTIWSIFPFFWKLAHLKISIFINCKVHFAEKRDRTEK